MATKRRSIDLTSNATSTPVAKWVKKVNKDFTSALKKSEITVLEEVAGNKDVLRAFFLSYGYFVGALSDGALVTFRRIFHDVISDNIAAETKDAMLRSGTNYPGHWDFFKIKTIVAATVSIDMIDGKLALGMVTPTDGDDQDQVVKPVMPFEDYNPNRLYQYATAVENATIAIVEAEVAHVIPSARRVAGSMKLNERYGGEFNELVTKAGIDFPEDIPDDMDEAADAVFSVIKKPIMSYVISLINESGVNLNLIRVVFGLSEDKLMYSADTNTGRVAAGFVHPWVKIDYIIYDKDNPMERPTFSATMGDVKAIFGKDPSASCKARIGTAFQRFVESLVPYTLNMASRNPAILFDTRAESPKTEG